MELRQLRYFLAVAEELHFGRAALRLHMAQPPLSKQIKNLEEELDVVLFDRTNRKVRLTPEGRKLVDVARTTLKTLTCGLEQVQRMSRGEIGRLTIGFINTATQTSFPHAVAEFRRRYPGIALDLREMNSHIQRDAVRDEQLDAGLALMCSHVDMSGFEFMIFMRDNYLLAVHEDHPLANREMACDLDLHGESLIMFPRVYDPVSYDKTMSRFREHGVEPNVVQEAGTIQTKLSLVATGMGVGFVPSRTERGLPQGVRLVPYDHGTVSGITNLKLIWRAGHVSSALQCFIDVMRKYAETDC